MSSLGATALSAKIAAIVSTGGCEEKPAMDETAQSTAPAPASAAAKYVAVAMPLVAWEWTWIGIEISLQRAETRRRAGSGARMPAMSLMQIESTPICSCSLAMRTNSSIVWTGETV